MMQSTKQNTFSHMIRQFVVVILFFVVCPSCVNSIHTKNDDVEKEVYDQIYEHFCDLIRYLRFNTAHDEFHKIQKNVLELLPHTNIINIQNISFVPNKQQFINDIKSKINEHDIPIINVILQSKGCLIETNDNDIKLTQIYDDNKSSLNQKLKIIQAYAIFLQELKNRSPFLNECIKRFEKERHENNRTKIYKSYSEKYTKKENPKFFMLKYLNNHQNAHNIMLMHSTPGATSSSSPTELSQDEQHYQLSSVSVHHMYPLASGGPSIFANYILVTEVNHAKIHTSLAYSQLDKQDNYISSAN